MIDEVIAIRRTVKMLELIGNGLRDSDGGLEGEAWMMIGVEMLDRERDNLKVVLDGMTEKSELEVHWPLSVL